MAATYEYELDEDAARELGLLPPEPPRPPPGHRWSTALIESWRRTEIAEAWRRCAAMRRRGRGLGDWDG